MNNSHFLQDINIDNESFTLLSIVTTCELYFIAGELHRNVQLNLQRMKDFEFYNAKLNILEHNPTYLFYDKNNGLLYLLLTSSTSATKNLKIPGFILMILGRDCEKATKKLIPKIKQLNCVMTCLQIYPNKVKETKQTQNIIMQSSLFNEESFESVKKKRKKIVKDFSISEQALKNFKEDIQINLYDDNLVVL